MTSYEKRDQSDYLEVAYRIGRILCRDAMWANDQCNWVGPFMEYHDGQWQVVSRVPDGHLYGGTSGIALFLGYLEKLTQDSFIRETAIASMNHALTSAADIPPERRIGFHTGSLGIAYAAIKLGELMPDTHFIEQGLALMKMHQEDYQPNAELDVISGSAGAIPVLISEYKKYPNNFLEDLITIHAQHLLSSATHQERGLSWNMPNIEAYEPLTGYSHGTSGVAIALLEAYAFTGEESFKEGGLKGFQYEDSWYDPTVKNWPDMRNNYNQPRPETFGFSCQWCHGAAGIMLSRIRAWQILQDKGFLQQVIAAGDTTMQTIYHPETFGLKNFSLCHGMAGNALILTYCSKVLEKSNWMEVANLAASRGIEWYAKPDLPWPGGVMNEPIESPSLMLGLAGIGYFYLYLSAPQNVPNILMVAP